MSFSKDLYESKNAEYYFQEREEMLKFVKPDMLFILDVGCSSGGFGKLLKEKMKCTVWGIEPTESAIEASKYLDKVIQDYFHSSLKLDGNDFDAVIFNDVLEHLVDPWEALSYSKSILKKNGYIIASIPNIQCYQVLKNLVTKGEWNYAKSGILDKTHLRFFTKDSIKKLFHDTGFEVIEIEGQNSVLNGSRLLKILNFIVPGKIDPFLYVNYGVCARSI